MAKKATKKVKCYFCNKEIEEVDLVEKRFPIATKSGTKMYKRKFHLECVPKYIKAKNIDLETREEDTAWDKVYRLFRELLGLDEKRNLPRFAVLRLRGLRIGQFVPNGQNVKCLDRGYSYDTILNTLKFSSSEIRQAITNTKFKNQTHMVNYIMQILVNHIDFIEKKMSQQDKVNEMLQESIAEVENTKSAEYVKKGGNENRVAELFDKEEVESVDDWFN